MSYPAFQAPWIEILVPNKKNIICQVLYKQHNSLESFLSYFNNTVEWWFNISNKPVFIIGDFNIESCNYVHYYTLNSLSLFRLAESVQWIFKISACDIITADYTIIMLRTLKVMGNHVMYDHVAWFLRVIISSSLAFSCLPLVKKQKHGFFCFVQCMIKLQLQLITPTSTLIILDITKTESNNCL